MQRVTVKGFISYIIPEGVRVLINRTVFVVKSNKAIFKICKLVSLLGGNYSWSNLSLQFIYFKKLDY